LEEYKIEINELANILWDYHHMGHVVKERDCILVLGSHDIRVAERGAELFLEGLSQLLIFSGGLGRLTLGLWDKPEAEIFAETAIKMGVPEGNILIENQSTNTGENIIFTRKLLKEKNLNPESFIVVQKPYMERRAFATFKKIWPEAEISITSPQMDFEEYCKAYESDKITKDNVISIMVGDLQRIMLYPQKGFQIYQEVPEKVTEAYNRLVELGYTRHLV
jgi:uncharacterized SAM-binding protein YcdF (DUF218 family)